MPSVKTSTNETARLNLRLSAELKNRIERAAIVSSMTVTEFVIFVLAKSTGEALEQRPNRMLSNHDRDLFVAMLENPPEPNKALRKAAKTYTKCVQK